MLKICVNVVPVQLMQYVIWYVPACGAALAVSLLIKRTAEKRIATNRRITPPHKIMNMNHRLKRYQIFMNVSNIAPDPNHTPRYVKLFGFGGGQVHCRVIVFVRVVGNHFYLPPTKMKHTCSEQHSRGAKCLFYLVSICWKRANGFCAGGSSVMECRPDGRSHTTGFLPS